MRNAGDALHQLLKTYDLEGKVGGSIFNAWKDIAGPEVSSHSKVKDIRNQVLLVEVDHPGWIQLMHMKKKQVLASVRRKYPELGIMDIRFYLCTDS